MDFFIKFFKLFFSNLGFDPMLENLSVITFNLSKSLSISLLIKVLSEFLLFFKYSFHPIRDDKGVPSWCAVSLAKPVHNPSLSDLLE